jgi:hypothetical protein
MDEARRPGCWERKLELLAQRHGICPVDVVVPVVQMRLDLERGRRAPNLSLADAAQTLERLARPKRIVGAELRLPPVPVRVEPERMEVELAALRIAQDVGRGPLILVDVTELREDRGQALDVLGADREVEIVVRPTLATEQCVDTPAPVEPPVDGGSILSIEYLEDVRRVHPGQVGAGLKSRATHGSSPTTQAS